MSEAEIDIPAFENFISQTLQPRLEELLTERDAMVKIKGDYDQTRTSLGGLQAGPAGAALLVQANLDTRGCGGAHTLKKR